jgi:hypothetical protein
MTLRVLLRQILAEMNAADHESHSTQTASANRWITKLAALSEGHDAMRKHVLRMTYPDLVQMIELRERKAAETRQSAHRARKVLAEHPEWQDTPSMTLAEVLGLDEAASGPHRACAMGAR